MTRNFLSFDGEAIDDKYCLLANDLHDTLENKDGITTDEVLEWFTNLEKKYYNRHYIWVGFGLNYDVEMWLKDLPDANKKELFYFNETKYKGYELQYIPRKFLRLKYKLGSQRVIRYIYDVFSFFQGSFIHVVETQLGKTSEVIEWGKAERSIFKWKDYKKVKEYNFQECIYLTEIMENLKTNVDKLNIPIKHWYGASALAQATLNKWNADLEYTSINEGCIQDELLEAWNYGYFGGRIELIKLGTFKEVYSYDINSAYPAAITHLPKCLYYWRKCKFTGKNPTFSIWKVRYNYKNAYIPVFPHRNSDGSIQFRNAGTGWYWYPEVIQAKRLYGDAVTIEYGYEQTFNSPSTLANKVQAMYDTRQRYKAKKDTLEYTLKIILNSVYGKFAQSVGEAKYRNIAYAGFITSYTRAKLMQAMENPNDVIGFATDCIYTTKPLSLPISKTLGEWSENKKAIGTFIMPGLYRLQSQDDIKIAQRGYGNQIDFTSLIMNLNLDFERFPQSKKEEKAAKVRVKNFIGYKRATTQYEAFGAHYLKFVEYDKEVNPSSLEKRRYTFRKGFKWHTESIDSIPYAGRMSTHSHIYQKAEAEDI